LRFSATVIADRMLPATLAGAAKPWTERLDAILTDKSVNGDAQRMSLIAFVIRLVSAAIAFLSQILLARWIGDFQYGIFVLVWATAVIVGNLSCFGFHTTIIRFVPEYFANAKHDDLRGLLLTGRLFAILSASLIAGLGALGVYLFSDAIENYYIVPFYLGMLILPMIALGDTLDGTARANSWPVRALSPTYIIRPVLILAFMLLALQLGFDASAQTAILAAIAATYATTIFQLISVTTHFDRKLFAMVLRFVADIPCRRVPLSPDKCRCAGRRLFHGSAACRRVLRDGQDFGAGAFRLLCCEGGRGAALFGTHPHIRPRQAGRVCPRRRIMDLLAGTFHGLRRHSSRQAAAFALRPQLC
jgi:hypothetical protein